MDYTTSPEIVAFDSQAWEGEVNDSSRFDETKLHGVRWMWVDELGRTLDPMNHPAEATSSLQAQQTEA